MGRSWNRSLVTNRREIVVLIRKAHNMGINLFDTAEVYGPFVNEELVSDAIAPVRKNIALCSKFGFDIQNGKHSKRQNDRWLKQSAKTHQGSREPITRQTEPAFGAFTD
jgi:aryl-alcohol dehydrogenase-like predicted oxidoreductase